MVQQRLILNFTNILRAKFHFFLKKSIWKYLLASVLLGFAKPVGDLNSLLSAVIYFMAIMIIIWPLLYLRAKTQSKSSTFDALVEFEEDVIRINHNNKDEIETKDWNWIKNIEIKKERIWLTINQVRPFGISLPKSKLTTSEINFFENIKKTKYD